MHPQYNVYAIVELLYIGYVICKVNNVLISVYLPYIQLTKVLSPVALHEQSKSHIRLIADYIKL